MALIKTTPALKVTPSQRLFWQIVTRILGLTTIRSGLFNKFSIQPLILDMKKHGIIQSLMEDSVWFWILDGNLMSKRDTINQTKRHQRKPFQTAPLQTIPLQPFAPQVEACLLQGLCFVNTFSLRRYCPLRDLLNERQADCFVLSSLSL